MITNRGIIRGEQGSLQIYHRLGLCAKSQGEGWMGVFILTPLFIVTEVLCLHLPFNLSWSLQPVKEKLKSALHKWFHLWIDSSMASSSPAGPCCSNKQGNFLQTWISYKLINQLRYVPLPCLDVLFPELASKLLVEANSIFIWHGRFWCLELFSCLFTKWQPFVFTFCYIALINGPLNVFRLLYPVLRPYMPYHLTDAINRIFF